MSLILSPTGQLRIKSDDDSSDVDAWCAGVEKAFQKGVGAGLVALSATEPLGSLPPVFSYWREFSRAYFVELCRTPESTTVLGPIEALPQAELMSFVLKAPPMDGGEYLTVEVLAALWEVLDEWVRESVEQSNQTLGGWLKKHAKSWHQVGRVCFHLAENKKNPDYPFAFLATFSSQLSQAGKVQYKPLGQALQDYAGGKNERALTQLLSPVQRAAEEVAFVHELVDSGDLFHPLTWTPEEAYQLLSHAQVLEHSGILLRLPNWWKKRPRPQVSVQIDGEKNGLFGVHSMLDFKVGMSLGGEDLSPEEWEQLMNAGPGLAFIKGQWVEVDQERLGQVLDHWKLVEQEARDGGMTFIEGMRLLSGSSSDLSVDGVSVEEKEWVKVEAGEWLSETLSSLRSPQNLAQNQKIPGLKGSLRPYQQIGHQWLQLLSSLGLGACLADDMGLGKTVQIISLLLTVKAQQKRQATSSAPSLLVLPASLLANWKGELERFAPSLQAAYIHPSLADKPTLAQWKSDRSSLLDSTDLVLTTYGMLSRQEWLAEVAWNIVIIDEAQAIKNPSTRQTKAVKALQANARIALTGTPVENQLSDLWSLFDFICPGLLGGPTKFKAFAKQLNEGRRDQYGALRNLVSPYILRRLKTDKSIISDLPDKTEVKAYCGLSKGQAALYKKAVDSLREDLEGKTGMKRKGAVLSALTAFKQICNHPSQFLGDGQYEAGKSGKFAKLISICEEIASRQEKVLIFTQYREMTEPIAATLAKLFGSEGLILHGGTPVKQRQQLVKSFQAEEGPSFFVLSLKAGGTGLTLTAASHVIHFDRWWNPAVENQATDRAFRIGQKNNVVVHKFICQGTLEEKVDQLLEEKASLAENILKQDGEPMLTEMSDEALLDAVALNVDRAMI